MLRFASSPTGDMNIGNLRVALFNFILAKQLNEDLLIRVDDTDKQKNIEGKEKEILELLSLFSIDYKTAVYQSENLKYHQKMAMQLMAQKKAFACFCSDEKLNELKEKAQNKGKVYSYDGFCSTLSDDTVLNCNAPFTVRMQKPNENIKFTDQLRGDFEFKPYEVDAFFILGHDKHPTYNYACAVDDMLHNISTIVRLDTFIEETPRQIHIRNELGYEQNINYYHVPTISDDITVKSLIDEGYLPSAIANYLVLLENVTPTDIFSLEDAVEWFDIKKVSTENAQFDLEKLRDINKKHLELMDDMRLSKILGFADTDIGKLGKLFLNECSTIKEIKSKLDLIFSSREPLKESIEEFDKLNAALKNAPYMDNLDDLEGYLEKQTPLNKQLLDKLLRYILTGRNEGPALKQVYALIKNYLGEIVK